MSIFGFYFVSDLLSEMGWPRKQGIRKRQVYDLSIVDVAIAQSVDWGAALGAGRPRLSLQMIAEMFRDRDWDSDDAPNVKMVIDELAGRATWSAAASPQDAVQPPQLGEHGRSISWEEFNEPKWRPIMEQLVLDALLWGLSNPDRLEAWYGANLAHRESMTPTYRQMGLDIELAPPPLPEFLANSEQIVRDYERDIGPLPAIPPRLLDDATALGWRISD
jgi:hypothetical protein